MSKVLKLAKIRDKKLERANDYFQKMRKLEDEAEDIDMEITETCDHPQDHLKLKHFSDDSPQRTFWLCTVCYQSVEYDPNKKEEKMQEIVDDLYLTWDTLPIEALRKDFQKQTKE
jgi:hypothetical protein